MARIDGGTARRLEELCTAGSALGVGDGRLISRFVDGRGVDREDAFAALVQRHGPMVLSTCRRMLGDGHDADDAFQAVFLVLARRAASLRGSEDVGGWLREVAVRTAKEARSRTARLRARAGAPLVDAVAAPAVDPDLFELRAALEEELERLPGRFRNAILLCELDGLSRRDAADRLGLAEGTLSSRLARGKSLLRDRLARRGMAVSLLAAATAPPAHARVLPESAVRIALQSIHGGTASGAVSEAVASLAEGVLAMLVQARWKLIAKSAATLAGVGLAVGVTWASALSSVDEPLTAASSSEPRSAAPVTSAIRGVVVDEAGLPIAGAEVLLDPGSLGRRATTTGADGDFAFDSPPEATRGRAILARVDGARLVGLHRIPATAGRAALSAAARIDVRPPRVVAARVLDARGEPASDADVEVVAGLEVVASGRTDAEGSTRLAIPTGVDDVRWIAARKRGGGFGCRQFGDVDIRHALSGVSAGELPPAIDLVLDEPRTLRVRVVDETGAPMAGVPVTPNLFLINGTFRGAGPEADLVREITRPDGIATFDWLPNSRRSFDLRASAPGRVFPSIGSGSGEAAVLHAQRPAVIRGTVTLPDGSPAPNVRVESTRSRVRTRADGTYVIEEEPQGMQAVWVVDEDYAAAPRMDVVATPGAPTVVDFRLERGILIRGMVSAGRDRRPQAGALILLAEDGVSIPHDVRSSTPEMRASGRRRGPIGIVDLANATTRPADPGPKTRRTITASADDRGRFALRVSPGNYRLSSPGAQEEAVVVNDGDDVKCDVHIRVPFVRILAGRVLDEDDRPAVGARVEIEGLDTLSASRSYETDAEGRFRAEVRAGVQHIAATGADGNCAGTLTAGEGDADVAVRLKPAARLAGTLCDHEGRPMPRRRLNWSRVVPRTAAETDWVQEIPGPPSFTDDAGRLASPPLVVGVEYVCEVLSPKGPGSASICVKVRADRPGAMDRGEIRIDDAAAPVRCPSPR